MYLAVHNISQIKYQMYVKMDRSRGYAEGSVFVYVLNVRGGGPLSHLL